MKLLIEFAVDPSQEKGKPTVVHVPTALGDLFGFTRLRVLVHDEAEAAVAYDVLNEKGAEAGLENVEQAGRALLARVMRQ